MLYYSLRILGFCTILTGPIATGPIATAEVIRDTDVGPYQLIRPVSGVVVHGGERQPVSPELYNGDGLDHDNPLFAVHGSEPDTIWQYDIGRAEYPVSLEFDLGADFLVGEMWVWQAKLNGETDRGIEDFDIILKDANRQEVGVMTNGIQMIKATGMQPVSRFSAFGECVFLPFPDCVRYVELRIRSNLGDPVTVNLAEIAFAGRSKSPTVPEPGSLNLVLVGVVCLAAGPRNRRPAQA